MHAFTVPEVAPSVRAAGHGQPLSYVLSPFSADEFRRQFFERAPLHVERADPAYFAGVYDAAEVESSLFVGGFEYDKFAMVKSRAAEVSAEALTIERRSVRSRHTGRAPRRTLDPRAVLTHFDNGYTLVIKDAATFSARLQKFVNGLQQQLGFYVQANVYFTPPKSQGFEAHHDTHDTLVMQIEGTKVWRIYEPVVELPVETQPFSKEEHGSQLRLLREVTLRPGDTLYVPHGFPHEAAANETRTLHVTLALCPTRVIDLLEAMLDLAAVTDVELRRSLPPGWHESSEFAEKFATLARERLRLAFRSSYVAPAAEMVLREMFSVTRPDGSDAFKDLERCNGIGATTRLGLREDVPHLFRRTAATVELLVAGKCVAFPNAYDSVFRRLERGGATLHEVDAALPNNVGRALLKLLQNEGVLAVS